MHGLVFSLCVLYHLTLGSCNRYYCYQGSSMYQLETADCGDIRGGEEWWCSRISVCEKDINSDRDCILTRGCATKSECTNPSTGKHYSGQHVVLANGTRPAGMRVSVDCCKASKFADDDAVAIDMSEVCNSAFRMTTLPSALAAVALTILLVALLN